MTEKEKQKILTDEMEEEEEYIDTTSLITKPHDHDVLCGRGGLTNQHPGNEWFRRLVRSNRALYRSCPKHTKLLVAKAIFQAVQKQVPPGRFLEIANKENKTWKQINYKRAVDKTSQALRERGGLDEESQHATKDIESVVDAAVKAAETARNSEGSDLSSLTNMTLKTAGLEGTAHVKANAKEKAARGGGLFKKRKNIAASTFIKPAWWSRGTPVVTSPLTGVPTVTPGGMDIITNSNKRMKMTNNRNQQQLSTARDDEPLPLPSAPLESRQSSLFRYLNTSGIFGSSNRQQQQQQSQQPFMQQQPEGWFGSSMGRRSSTYLQQAGTFSFSRDMPSSVVPANNFRPGGEVMGRMKCKHQSLDDASPVRNNVPHNVSNGNPRTPARLKDDSAYEDVAPSPPSKGLKTQVSDWLTTFFPLGKDEDDNKDLAAEDDDAAATPPPPNAGRSLSRSISSSIFGLVESPSLLLTNLKSGMTSIFGDPSFTDPIPVPTSALGNHTSSLKNPPGPSLGESSSKKRSSLLDDFEESPMETQLRNIRSN